LIWPKIIGPTGLGTASVPIQLGGKSVTIPAKAKSLLAVIPHVQAPAGNTAAQPIAASLMLKSNDNGGIVPWQVLLPPIGSSLLKSVAQFRGPNQVYPVNCPVIGGSTIDVYGQTLFNHTIQPWMGVTLLFADFVPGPQYHAKIGTFQNTGTAVGEAADPNTLRITSGHLIKEVGGLVVGTTVAALTGILGWFRLASSNYGKQAQGLTQMGDMLFMADGPSGQVDTNIQECTYLQRVGNITPLDIPIEDPCDISIFFDLAVALTTTGNFCTHILYT
jgi:hypothetical protein